MDGIYYPCSTPGCNSSLRIKDDISNLELTDQVVLECPKCKAQKIHSLQEVLTIINSEYV